ncbi:MAG TPA: hypothetical protein VKH37_11590, partial [Ferruginibacter sp.]|nr:hypothetical protein [Ferruginibacter sp.]
TKQWQMGELNADDAGSPVFAKININYSYLNKYKAAANVAKGFESFIPLETKAEQKKIQFSKEGKITNIDIRLQMGRYWLKMLKKQGLNYASQYIEKYGFDLPANIRSNDYVYANKEVWQQYAAISGRCIDGYKLYEHINEAASAITSIPADITALNILGNAFKAWYESMYYQPLNESDNAWVPNRLEYQFECAASAGAEEKTLAAKEYYSGQLDWHSFDIKPAVIANSGIKKQSFIDTLIPSKVKFSGMPDTRWWKFEDGKTYLGDLHPSTTDLSKLLLTEFALLFSNDWFLIPCKLPIGSLSNIDGLVVKNNFGESFWVTATEVANTVGGLPWSMFKLHADQQNNTLFLAPTITKVSESKPIEEVVLIRDEMANMVWGIEKQVPLSFGAGDKGNEVALRISQFHEKIVALINRTRSEAQSYYADLNSAANLSTPLTNAKTELNRIITALAQDNCDVYTLQNDLNNVKLILKAENRFKPITPAAAADESTVAAKIRYQAMTEVPENWIPFIPVHIPNDVRKTQLQRASMLRIVEGDLQNPVKIKPQTSILREGLDVVNTAQAPYYLHEEEVPRSGVRVSQSFLRTRWTNGEVFVWLGRKKNIGKGEGSSGLAFDQIIDT